MNIKLNFNLCKKQRKRVYELIEKSSTDDFGFYTMTILSALIVALGLFINSVSVVIGGMLLAPIFNHILGLALSISRGSIKKFRYHIVTLAKAIFLAIGLTIILFYLLPNSNEAGSEILARSNPNIIHLFIALLSGIAGAVAMAWPGIATSIIGVLIASALIPPLATLSYGIIISDPGLTGGALLLFSTNFVAIVFAATITFFVLGFKPSQDHKAQEFMQRDIKWSIVLMVLIIVPLTYSFFKANQEDKYEQTVNQVLKSNIEGLQTNEINALEINQSSDKYQIKATIMTNKNLSNQQKDKIEQDISFWLKKEVDLTLMIINTDKIE